MCVNERLQPLLKNMCIDLGGRNVSMTEKLLHGSEIRAAIEQMAREGVAQHVRRDALGADAGLGRNVFQILREALPRHMTERRFRREEPRRIVEAP